MRRCKGKYFKDSKWYCFKVGKFHQWTTDYEFFNDNVVEYTVGLVELKDGNIIKVLPENITFLDGIW